MLSLDEQMDPQNVQSPTVRQVLHEKHPDARDGSLEALVPPSAAPQVHPVLFESLTGAAIRAAALRTNGSAGPSGVDAVG